jgi:MYXO-CTERM domain-containing protein
MVMDSAAAGAPAAPTDLLSGPGYRGVLLTRGALKTAVIGTDAVPVPGAPMTYRVPSGVAMRHIVLDAPRGDQGRSDVTAKAVGSDCEITVTAVAGSAGFDGAPLVIDVAPTCAAVDPGPGQVDGEGSSATPSSATVDEKSADQAAADEAAAKANADAAAAGDTGAGCTVSASHTSSSFAMLAGVMAVGFAARRRRRR